MPGLSLDNFLDVPRTHTLPVLAATPDECVSTGSTDLQKLTGAEGCVLGMVTGVMSKSVNYPFLSWKAVQQGTVPSVLL